MDDNPFYLVKAVNKLYSKYRIQFSEYEIILKIESNAKHHASIQTQRKN
jgi:hypothetical protein